MIKNLNFLILLLSFFNLSACQGQTTPKEMKENKTNPLLCDPETGMCEVPGNENQNKSLQNKTNKTTEKIKIIYFTDPICSSCWGIEPQLRKLKLEYGESITIEYRMGGLLPDWSYNSGGISQPSDVAHHWDEVSLHYQMPIDGDVWLEDPLDSSYPPSIAFKAAQEQDYKKAQLFMRAIREMVFLRKENIAKWENIEKAAIKVGLDPIQLKNDVEGIGKLKFGQDLELARKYNVRGFPTMIFEGVNGANERVYGSQPYALYEVALLKLNPAIKKQEYGKTWNELFEVYASYTLREFAEISGVPTSQSESLLNDLVENGKLDRFDTKNGSIWTIIQ